MSVRFWHAQCTVTVRHTDSNGNDWESTRQVPTFVVDTNVQGSDPEQIARSVIMTADLMGHIVAASVSVSPIHL